MIDIEALPVPDWGLRCPHCDTPLAGMQQHRCSHCGQTFNVLQLLAVHRPIPDIGLTCEQCDYLLTGLPGSRCPKCGTLFSVREMLEEQSPSGAVYLTQAADPPDHYIKKREPKFTGNERPLPDFGLSCAECEHMLAGASGDTCPACGLGFDLLALLARRDWVNINRFVPPPLTAIAKTVLYDAQIPYMIDNAKLRELYGGNIPFLSGRLRVPRSFFFDALFAFAAAAEPATVGFDREWDCPACNEQVPAGFELCWNCNAPHPNHADDETGPS